MASRGGSGYRTLALYVIGITTAAALTVELRAPRFVEHGHNAVLRCEHSADPQYVYKVVFFKDGHRIMQHVTGRDPPFMLYNVTGLNIPLEYLTSTSLTLHHMDFAASGTYACEVALETPLYSKQSAPHDITVIVRQKQRPKIKIRNFRFASGDVMEATCQSSPAHPAPHLTWLINNVKVDERLTTPNGVTTTHRYHHGIQLQSTNTSLQFPLTHLQLQPNDTVAVTCVSTIPSYASLSDGFADVQNSTVAVKVRSAPMPTQMPVKIISHQLNSAGERRALDIMLHAICFALLLRNSMK